MRPSTKPITAPTLIELLNNGGINADFNEALRDAARDATEGVGSTTITLKLTIRKNGDAGVTVSPDLSVKRPKAKPTDNFLFAHPDGGLTRLNPNQIEMFEDADRP